MAVHEVPPRGKGTYCAEDVDQCTMASQDQLVPGDVYVLKCKVLFTIALNTDWKQSIAYFDDG